jgi:hypothetical protein
MIELEGLRTVSGRIGFPFDSCLRMTSPLFWANSWQPKEECRNRKPVYLESNQAEQDQQMRQ